MLIEVGEKAEVMVLTSDKRDFKARILTEDKGLQNGKRDQTRRYNKCK